MAPPQESKKAPDTKAHGGNSNNKGVAVPRTEGDPSMKATSGITRLHGSENRDEPYYPTAYIVLPGELKMPIAMSGDSFRLSSKLRESCKAYIECDRDDTAIRVVGKTPAHVQAAIRDINDAIRGLRTKEATGHQHLLVQPPSTPTRADGVVILHPSGVSKQGTRPRFQARGRDLAAPIPNFTPSCHEDTIVQLFRETMSTLQAMGCNLKMRANFGFLRLHQQRRAPSEYDLRRFVAISDTLPSRATTRLDTSLGPGVNGDKILKHFMSSFSASLGNSASAGLDFEAYHTLTLISSDARIEATITYATDKNGDTRQRITSVEMFRRNWNRLDLNSASPHMKHDWNLEVVVKEPVRPKPAWLDNLKHRVSLSAPPKKDVFSHIPKLRIDPIPELVNSVETTVLETSVNLRYPNTPYDINVSVTRTWMGTNTHVSANPVCTVSMRGINWDERMTSVGSWKEGNWEPELGMIFSEGESSFRDGFVKFIQIVKRSQTILGEVHSGDPAPGSS